MARPRMVLVVNSGSSSLKYQVLDADTGEVAAFGLVERIGGPGRLKHTTGDQTHTRDVTCRDHKDALDAARAALREHGPDLDELGLFAVGHRVVHGGP
ncbi:MAG: acetate kinase, partial [Pedococcus sp.]